MIVKVVEWDLFFWWTVAGVCGLGCAWRMQYLIVTALWSGKPLSDLTSTVRGESSKCTIHRGSCWRKEAILHIVLFRTVQLYFGIIVTSPQLSVIALKFSLSSRLDLSATSSPLPS